MKVVLGVPAIALILLPKEDRARPAPACMSFDVARNAFVLVGVRALIGSVHLRTVGAFVCARDTLVREVVPPLALQASDRLLFNLTRVGPPVAYVDPVSYGSVCCVDIGEGDDEVGRLLTWGSALNWFGPPYGLNCVCFEVVGFANLLKMLHISWVNCQRNVKSDDIEETGFEGDPFS